PDGGLNLVSAAPRGDLNKGAYYYGLYNAYSNHDRNHTEYQPARYAAFSDSHLDSLQNPAYATEFRQRAGRLYLIPSFTPATGPNSFWADNPAEYQPKSSFNHTLSPQLSYFLPLGSKFVVGGGATLTQTDLRGSDATSGSGPTGPTI